MIFAAYADVGAGLAFLLLLTPSVLGLVTVLFSVLWRPARLRGFKWYALFVAFLQAWLVFFWARNRSDVPRGTLEWVWLGSLVIVIVAFAVCMFTVWREEPA